MNQADYYDKFTNDVFVKYFSTHNPRLAAAKKLCDKFVSNGDMVLEIGCGVGIVAKSLVNRVASYTGLDLSKEAISIAQTVVPKGWFFQGDAVLFKVGYNKYDAIILIDVLEHLTDLKATLKKLESKLTADGRMILSWPTSVMIEQLKEQSSEKLQSVDNAVTVAQALSAVKLHPVYLNYVDCEFTNQYVQLVLAKQLPVEPIEPNKLLSGLKSRWLRLKNRKILELLRNLPS